MHIGIIVYSGTGHTASVAVQLRQELESCGHAVQLERLQAARKFRPGDSNVRFESLPNAERCEALVFGSPVHGGTPAAPIISYLAQIESLQGKPVACLVTEFFPFPWMGGNQAIRQMEQLCASKGATVGGTGIVNWMSLSRQRKIQEVVERLSAVFETT